MYQNIWRYLVTYPVKLRVQLLQLRQDHWHDSREAGHSAIESSHASATELPFLDRLTTRHRSAPCKEPNGLLWQNRCKVATGLSLGHDRPAPSPSRAERAIVRAGATLILNEFASYDSARQH